MIIRLSENQEILYQSEIISEVDLDPGIPIIEFILEPEKEYELFVNDVLESSYFPTTKLLLAIFPTHISYHRISHTSNTYFYRMDIQVPGLKRTSTKKE